MYADHNEQADMMDVWMGGSGGTRGWLRGRGGKSDGNERRKRFITHDARTAQRCCTLN